MDIGKPKEVVEVKEPAVPFRGTEVPSEDKKPAKAPATP